jgi:hypothetical protein
MYLDESKLLGHDIFLLKESVLNVVVSRKLKEAIEAADLKGFMLITDEEYEPGML